MVMSRRPSSPPRRTSTKHGSSPNCWPTTKCRNVALARLHRATDLHCDGHDGKVRAEETGRMKYRAPDKKNFATTSESGSVLVRRLALNPLIASEIDAAFR